MKKTVLITLLSAISLMAQGAYMGFAIEGSQTFRSHQEQQAFAGTTEQKDFEQNAYGLKILIGGEAEGNLRTNLTFGMTQYEGDLFPKDFSDEDQHKDNGFIYSFGFEMMKAFPVSAVFMPTIVGGFDFGFMDLEGYVQDNANYTAWKLGVGMLNRMNMIELETQIFLRHRAWGDYNYEQALTQNITVQENTINLSIGLNFHY